MIERRIRNRRKPTNSYPLATVFVFVALSATLIGIVTGAVTTAKATDKLEYGIVFGFLLGIGIGAIVGLYHHRRLRGLWIGLTTGGVFGALIGPVFVNSNPRQTITTCLVGSAIIVLVGVFFTANSED